MKNTKNIGLLIDRREKTLYFGLIFIQIIPAVLPITVVMSLSSYINYRDRLTPERLVLERCAQQLLLGDVLERRQ